MENHSRVVGRGLIWWSAVMAALSYIAGAVTLSDVLGEKYAALFFMVVGALNSGTAVYVAMASSPGPSPPAVHRP